MICSTQVFLTYFDFTCTYITCEFWSVDKLHLQASLSKRPKVRFSSEIRLHSNSDDSVQIRRETALRLMNAQKLCRMNNNSTNDGTLIGNQKSIINICVLFNNFKISLLEC